MPITASVKYGYPIPDATTSGKKLLDIQATKSALVAIDELIDVAMDKFNDLHGTEIIMSPIAGLSSTNAQTIISEVNSRITTEANRALNIENSLQESVDAIQAMLNSNELTLDTIQEIVDYIQANKTVLDSVTTTKVNTADIVNVLTSTDSTKPLSAAQGKVLNDGLTAEVSNRDSAIASAVNNEATTRSTTDAALQTAVNLINNVVNQVTQTYQNKTLDNPLIVNGYTEESITANTDVAYTVDLTNGTLLNLTLTANCMFTFPAAEIGRSFTMFLKQDGSGNRSATWPGSVKWPNATAPTITASASKADKLIFTSDSSSWFGSVAGQNY